jgi:hypothetical protein
MADHRLNDLLERVKGATGSESDRRLGYDALVTLLGRDGAHGFLYHGQGGRDPATSIDAALDLVERKLPGWAWSVGNLQAGGQAYVMRRGGPLIGGVGKTAPLAILDALLTALSSSPSPALIAEEAKP